jgi:hypothetical protein
MSTLDHGINDFVEPVKPNGSGAGMMGEDFPVKEPLQISYPGCVLLGGWLLQWLGTLVALY